MSTNTDFVRRKRLLALGVPVDGMFETQGNSDLDNKPAFDRETHGKIILTKPKALRKRKQSSETRVVEGVVDLCSSSDDESEKVRETSRKKAATLKVEKFSHRLSINDDFTSPNSNPASLVPSNELTKSFQVATWNVWFGPPNDVNPHVQPRMKELVRLAVHGKRSQPNSESPYLPPWFIGLQEVTRESAAPLAQALKKAGYDTIVSQESDQNMPYFCQLAIRSGSQLCPNYPTLLETGSVEYTDTCMGRGFCYARVQIPTFDKNSSNNKQSVPMQLLVATTHLESWAGKDYPGAAERQKQLLEFEQNCREEFNLHPELKWAILMGDLNWDDNRKGSSDVVMSSLLSLPWKDVYLEHIEDSRQQKDSLCYTYDGKLNPMLNNSLRRRFDRCLVFACDDKHLQELITCDLQLLGQQCIPGLRFIKKSFQRQKECPVAPSDHFGLVTKLQLT